MRIGRRRIQRRLPYVIPHPEGDGAYLAMQQALSAAGLKHTDVDYINLHGTATIANDLAEGKAVARVFSQVPACSSTKGFTGHTSARRGNCRN